MIAETEKQLPAIVAIFPGLEDRVYFQNPETLEYWFQANNVCRVLGFSNASSALSLHCEEDEKFMEVYSGRDTWFVSEAGCYGLAMGAKNEIAKKFKRWLKHEVLPKLRAEGGYIMPTASSEQLVALQEQCEQQQKKILALQSQNKSQAKRSEERRLLNVKRSDEARKAREERDRQKRRGDAYEAECKMWQRWVTNTQKTVDKMKKEFSKHQDANGKFQVDRIYQEMYSQITTRR